LRENNGAPSVDHPEVHDFIAFLRLKNVSPGTIGQYEWTLHDLFRFLPAGLNALHDVTRAQLRAYVADLQTRGLAPKTVSDRVTILKRCFGYLHAEGQIAADPAAALPQPRMGKRLPKALSLEETEAFLLALTDDSSLGRRDRILFELMYGGGLRVGEAVGLRVADFDFEDGSVRVVGKGDRERRVYLKPALLQALREYIVPEPPTGFLFLGYRGKPLTVRNVQLRIKAYAKAAGIRRRVTPHTLRHSIAVHYLQGGAPINFIQNFLGHAKLSTTGKYLQLSDRDAKRIALNTTTALDRIAPSAEESQLRETPVVLYRPDGELELCDAYVSDVLEWLAAR
jgi:site-specific recombinase XerD